MINKIKKTKTRLIYFFYAFIGVILALFFLVLLNYASYYVHELGHANSVVLNTFIQEKNSTTINFTYSEFSYLTFNTNLKVPQQTIAKMHPSLSTYGVLFTIIFYSFIFSILLLIKRVRKNKILQLILVASLILLVIKDVLLNWICGTDGFNIGCSSLVKDTILLGTNFALFLSLGAFFSILFFKKGIIKIK